MDAASILVVFPAFLIGAAFGSLIVLVLAGGTGLKSFRPVLFSIAGSLAGVGVFLATQQWWPPIIGPFIVCPPLAAIAALLCRKK